MKRAPLLPISGPGLGLCPGLVLLLVLWVAAPAGAGSADVLDARVQCRPAPGGRAASVCKFSVTIRHADTGWDHYANRYEILGPDGQVIGRRVLRHPHVEEQPFTRGISNLRIPHDVSEVVVRAGDLVHGLGGATVTVAIPHGLPAPAPALEAAPQPVPRPAPGSEPRSAPQGDS